MSVLTIVKIGHAVLRRPAELVTKEDLEGKPFQKFLKDMVETMRAAEGVGLAANQVGRPLQAMALECASNRRYPEAEAIPLEIYVNPKILERSRETEEDWEGCLSIPGYRGRVPRAKEITFEALTGSGQPVRKKVRGFLARILQHEVDHLSGFFYVDRMPDLRSWVHLEEFNQQLGKQIHER